MIGATIAMLLAASMWFGGGTVRAQTAAEPGLFITWRAETSYAPPGYRGKVLPATGSTISASLAIIENGKLVNLSGQTIYWYVNGNFVDGGVGAASVRFAAPGIAPNMIDLRAQLPDYNGTLTLKTISIPMVRPEVVIEAPFAGGKFGGAITMKARPFFFGVSSAARIVFTWTVGSEDVTSLENPDILTLTPIQGTANGSLFSIRAAAKNPIRFSEIAGRTITLTFSGQ